MTISISREKLEIELKEIIALYLYSKAYITSGMAARFVRISRIEFLLLAGKSKIPMFNYSKEELLRELKNA